MASERGPGQVQASYNTAAIIAAALIIGQLLFAAVSWWLHSSGTRTATDAPDVMRYIWIVVAIGGLAGANLVRTRLVAASELAERPPDEAVQTQVIMMWALIEAGGLLGIVLHLFTGNAGVLYAVVGYIVVCALFFFPRRQWFKGS